MNLLETLIKASERAASIARSCCIDSTNETLFVAEKGEKEANARFEKDFKTIADVLAQECARQEIAADFPELAKYVRGEECNEIGGVTIELQETLEETTKILASLLPISTAQRMAEAAHSEIDCKFLTTIPNIPLLNPGDLGVWIDPIDATAEFIAGVQGKSNADQGLPCVTVLIGAYLRASGEPVVGVINQPFYNGHEGRVIWGVHYNGIKIWHGSDLQHKSDNNIMLISGAENPEIIDKIKKADWEIKSIPGAGHKLLKVILGEADAYIVSKGTTFKWDTCGPHAILKARNGGLLSFSSYNDIKYNNACDLDTKEYSNSEGIIAYRSENTLEKILTVIK